jgi:tetratricopeptide (TPR) repeat protein
VSELKGGLQDSHSIASVLPVLVIALAANLSCSGVSAQTVHMSPAERLKFDESAVAANPNDPKKRFEFAESLRLSGDLKKAVIEYLDVTSLEPAYFIAYHEMVRSRPTEDQLDEAIDRLKKLEDKRPKNLMLRVALSEVLEKKGELYAAARTLVDLQYSHSIPEKYEMKINTRIHYLLSKAKDLASSNSAQHAQDTSEDVDATPLPLPDSSNGTSGNKLKDPKVTEGYGHARLLP